MTLLIHRCLLEAQVLNPSFFFHFVDVFVSDTMQACGRLPVFVLAVVCISDSGMKAQAWVPMAARTLTGRTTQTSSRD